MFPILRCSVNAPRFSMYCHWLCVFQPKPTHEMPSSLALRCVSRIILVLINLFGVYWCFDTLYFTWSKTFFSLLCLHWFKIFVGFTGPVSVNVLSPLWGKCCLARGKVNRSILEKGAMDNATPATTNNTRMEKRIALECGKRKPDEVNPRAFRGLRMSSNQISSF